MLYSLPGVPFPSPIVCQLHLEGFLKTSPNQSQPPCLSSRPPHFLPTLLGCDWESEARGAQNKSDFCWTPSLGLGYQRLENKQILTKKSIFASLLPTRTSRVFSH